MNVPPALFVLLFLSATHGAPVASADATGPRATLLRAGATAGEFPTIQEALDAAQAGDTVKIAPGVIHEVVTISGDRLEGGGVAVEGDPQGTVLDGADPQLQSVPNERWQPLEDGVYRTDVAWAGAPERANVTWVTPAQGPILAAYHNVEPWRAAKRGPGTLRRGRTVKIIPGALGNPGRLSLSVGVSEAVVRFSNARGWTLRNLELRHGGNSGVKIENGCSDLLLDQLTVRDTWSGLATDDDAENISRIKILNCRVLNRWNFAWPWAEGYADAEAPNEKFTAPMRGTGIDFYGKDSIIEGNLVDGGWDGMGIRGTNIAASRNIIRNVQDDAVELECGRSSNIRFFDNLIYGVFVGISTVSNQPGPIYIYRNRVSSNRLHASDPDKGRPFRFGFALKMGTDWGPGAANVYFYHNTFFAKRLALWDKEEAAWENFVFLNNIFVSDGQRDGEGLAEDVTVWNSGLAEKGCRWDGNLYWRTAGNPLLFRKWNGAGDLANLAAARQTFPEWEVHGLEADPQFAPGSFSREINAANELQPSAASPGRDKAVPLPQGWPDSACVPDGRPDIGATEFAAP